MRGLLALLLVTVTHCASPPEPVYPAAEVGLERSASEEAASEGEPPLVETRRIDPVAPAEAHLAATGKAERLALVAFYGALHASEPGSSKALAGESERRQAAHPMRVKVVEERPDSLRVILEERGVKLVVYLLRSDMHPVVRQRARAKLGSAGVPPETGPDGVWLRPGLIASDRRVQAQQAVSVDDAAFRGEAWVTATALDRLYEPEEEPSDEREAILAPGTAVSSEFGTTLFTSPDRALRVTLLRRDGARTRVRYLSKALWIEGWVPAAALDHQDRMGYGSGYGSLGGRYSGGRKRYLHAGAKLRAGPEGEAIGLVVRDRVRVGEGKPLEGGREIFVDISDWRRIPLWISGEEVAYGDRFEQVYRDRARIEPQPSSAEDLPWQITNKTDDVAVCWAEALAAGAKRSHTIRLTWRDPMRIAIPKAAGLDASLHGCLSRAFAEMDDVDELPPLPLSFSIHLEPLALPTRAAAGEP